MAQESSGIWWVAMGYLLVTHCLGAPLELPSSFSSLGSAEFKKRELAQADLVAWARKTPESALEVIYKQARISADPEVRERCMEVLRTLVDEKYSKEGEGYVGIALGDEMVTLPGNNAPQNVIRVIEVRADTPGHRAGILLNDLIIALEGKKWRGVMGSELFRQQIKAMKPETDANLTILRDDQLIELKVTLSRRPLAADRFFNGFNMDFDATERAAKDAYFNQWILQMKSNS